MSIEPLIVRPLSLPPSSFVSRSLDRPHLLLARAKKGLSSQFPSPRSSPYRRCDRCPQPLPRCSPVAASSPYFLSLLPPLFLCFSSASCGFPPHQPPVAHAVVVLSCRSSRCRPFLLPPLSPALVTHLSLAVAAETPVLLPFFFPLLRPRFCHNRHCRSRQRCCLPSSLAHRRHCGRCSSPSSPAAVPLLLLPSPPAPAASLLPYHCHAVASPSLPIAPVAVTAF
ncbi:hypothetical protein B296_00023763 [Ensete ventricosum]|uniref:Uncharacterized protein n=1 Tax=Ensete ventricosum TaxID=4639 RepID=A0A426ZH20_ENSVE|nr:hypothetical protein B296_00023763 [Ensete ventricosum]